ncbi:MAG: NUDIX domain-containing protein [Defluviitaleaceae bacterium]|nr:NUDIX domain-containing protein [Defluviitaleaceae bacterium]MCL2240412.1 NUDIX domain-containing protein [Defluviitaleaceae bacterium]
MKENLTPLFGMYTKAFITYNRKVLIIKRSDYANRGKGEWDIPGGGLGFNETVLDCLHREIMEETGLTAYVDRLLYAVTAIIPGQANNGAVGLVYICRTDSDAVILSHEHTDYLWATKIQLMKLMSKSALDDYSNNGVFNALDID